MAVRSGFWNSVGTDVRTYYNHDFSHLISLMIKDGVHQNYGECLTVVQGTGMQAIVRTGEAWFNETWVRCDSDLQISVDAAPIVAGFSRIDAIAIKIDATQSVRNGTIEYIAGTATAETPSAPELVDTDEIHWHLLATILVRTGDEEVLGSRITNYVGTDTTPFISGILDTISAEVLLNQWQSEWSEWSDEKKREFTLWFNNLHYILDGDVAGHLQNEIENLYRSIGFTGTMAEVEAAIQAGTITVGMIVNITDDNDAEDFTALQVSYDGTESGSEATSVQGAIDELHTNLKNLKLFPDYSATPLHTFTASDSWTATEDCYIIGSFRHNSSGQAAMYVDGVPVAVSWGQTGSVDTANIHLMVKKGSVVTTNSLVGMSGTAESLPRAYPLTN